MDGTQSLALPESWKKDLLNKLSVNRSGVLQTDGITWQYFKMPSSWVQNGDLNKDRFRPLDEIVSRGERGNPVKIYESTNPRLAKYLYIRRTNSYSIWRIPRPKLDNPNENENISRNGSRGHDILPRNLNANGVRDEGIPEREASLPSDILDRMIQLPHATWDNLGRIRPDMWQRLLAVASEDRTNTSRQQRPYRPGLRQRRGPVNPSDRGDCPPRPSRIPIPIDRRRRITRRILEPAAVSTVAPRTANLPPASQSNVIAPMNIALTTISSSTQTEQRLSPMTVSRSTSTQRLPVSPISRVLKGEKAENPTSVTRDVSPASCSPGFNGIKSVTRKWWQDDLAISPRLMKVENLCEAAVEIRREEDGELVELGNGQFSVVYLADISQYGKNCFVAVKKFNKGTSPGDVKKEAGFLRVLADTSFVPHLFGYIASSLALVQECFGQGTTLEDLLSAAHVFTLPKASWFDIAIHLAVALRELFKRGVLHNDIKSENILVDWSSHGYPVKLIDLGRATYKTGYLYTAKTVGLAKRNQLAPELSLATRTTPASEVFSLGVVMKSIAQKGPVHELSSIAEPCLRANPAERPIISTVIKLLEIQQRHLRG